MKNKFTELQAELQVILSGKNHWLDTVIPPLLFILINRLAGLLYALVGAVVITLFISIYRISNRSQIKGALGGLVITIGTAGIAWYLGSAKAFFLPGILSSLGVAALSAISALIKKPITAYSSTLTRRWPLAWYWHPKVCPAYISVSWLWAGYFFARFGIQWWAYQNGSAAALGAIQLFFSWPGLLALLVISYLWGSHMLQRLGGPSVEEFKRGSPPPWQSQQRGF